MVMRWILLAAVMLLVPMAPSAGSAQESQATVLPVYRLNPGDVVRVSVWREDELLREARVQPDGSISYPLVGTVPAAGRSPAEVADDIRDRLAAFIPDAVVTVELLEAQGYRVFIVGEVNRPGEYQLSQPVTVMQALSIAGGLTPFAGQRNIRILRVQEQQMNIFFDFRAVARDGQLEKNIFLEAGDTIIVPTSFF
ncbi:MAG: polysaccharide export protein [Geminicoccaceae bacterium]|nr:MAG: polysaccharide export protein [Geminicoccaceae bacterium]